MEFELNWMKMTIFGWMCPKRPFLGQSPSIIENGHYWLNSVIFGQDWPFLAKIDHFWPRLTIFEPKLAIYEANWPFSGQSWSFFVQMALWYYFNKRTFFNPFSECAGDEHANGHSNTGHHNQWTTLEPLQKPCIRQRHEKTCNANENWYMEWIHFCANIL